MKTLSIFIFGLVLLMYSCTETEETIQPFQEQESQVDPNSLSSMTGLIKEYDISELVENKISNGFFYVVDKTNKITSFRDGNMVCSEDYPEAVFKRATIKSTAVEGIYRTRLQAFRYTESELRPITELELRPITELIRYCSSEKRYEFPCWNGYSGFIEYLVITCYSRSGIIISKEESIIRRRKCHKDIVGNFDHENYLDLLGDEILNPFCD